MSHREEYSARRSDSLPIQSSFRKRIRLGDLKAKWSNHFLLRRRSISEISKSSCCFALKTRELLPGVTGATGTVLGDEVRL